VKRDHWRYLAAAACGAAIWIVIALVTGKREAWDSGLYFAVGIPAVCLVAMVFAYHAPARPWRWGVLPMAGQLAWMVLSQGVGNMLPLGLIVFAILSIPPVVAAAVGAFVARRRRRAE